MCRYQKDDNSSVMVKINQELDEQSLIKGDSFNREKAKQYLMNKRNAYEYGNFTFDLKDVKTWNWADQDHTTIRLYGGETYVFKVDEQRFGAIYQTLMNTIVNDFSIPAKVPEINLN